MNPPTFARAAVAALAVLALLAPNAPAERLNIYNVDAGDTLRVEQQPGFDGRYCSFDLAATAPDRRNASFEVEPTAVQTFSLGPLAGALANGAWSFAYGPSGSCRFTLEVHIDDLAGYDGARPCRGGYFAVGGHPQFHVNEVVWAETGSQCVLQSPWDVRPHDQVKVLLE